MSNKVVSQVYRSIIDDVINNVRQDFEEMGIEKEVLEELQRSWEAKIIATQVAEFEGAPALPPAKSRSSKKQESKSEVKSEDANGASSTGDGADQHRSKVARADDSSDVKAAGDNNIAADAASGMKKEEDDNDAAAGQKRKRISDDDEIGSDLDDSDDEDVDGGADGDNDDMVLCLYDKVQRVKNKWKCVLKDGVASIEGRDYLFAKCNGEFEW
ncbi:related to TOA1 - transcription factor TFIIA-L [Melanopsichium pennsylvanicum]|uniref:Transcription initiation factor IIA large subunit n=2 Tax=Melanopsichium pennsylvanicum TaxID=63383 RepID=A0AAJ5C5G9_9BASI|nr:related to TOA1-transcription factor TFIIA-L [Melanopsichium pennsylvanicum 4]SNX84722.1 related to TOA1 - transcription factor TFIIA-L [Melanopsichium pennsylvanicum]